MGKFIKYSVCLIIILICSCQNNDSKKGAVIFTFDDQSIREWVKCSSLFDKYDIKATFFINRPDQLDSSQIAGLRFLMKKGHEIACHGLNHLNAVEFTGSPEDYYYSEVEPAKIALESLGFEIVSFAYPFGNSTATIDSFLVKKFKCLRKATWNKNGVTLDSINEIFANKNNYRIVNSIGLDNNYNISIENIETGLRRAKRNNEVLIFHAHIPDTSRADYIINPEYLERVFVLCSNEGIKKIRIKDLEKYFECH